MSKTPISVLQEICVKNFKNAPIYEVIADGSGFDKVFAYKVKAFDEIATGYGKSKKDAKHEASIQMLRKLEHLNLSEEREPREAPPAGEGNSVGDLHDICVARNIPLPQFNLVNATGPSHNPDFTFECRVASVIRLAKHSTKKGAKQLAAYKMLQVFQEISTDSSIMQIVSLEELMESENDKMQGTIRTYRDLKKSDIKKIPGITLYNRHNYFTELEEEKVFKARTILRENLAPIDKVQQVFNALGLKYEISDINSKMYGKKAFWELVGCDFDACLTAPFDVIYEKVVTYMKAMMNA